MSGGDLDPRWRDATRLIRSGGGPEIAVRTAPVTVNPPVQRGSTVVLPNAASLYDAPVTYGRTGLSTHVALQEALCELEHASRVALFPSGAAAVSAGLLAVLKAGDEVLVVDCAYGPTRRFCDRFLKRYGVATRYFPPRATAADLMALASPATRAILMESPGSLTFEMQDAPAVAVAARAHGIVTLIDNTWAAGALFKPLDHGVDVSIQALTKYVGGHADVFMGSVAVRDSALGAKVEGLVHDMGWAVSADDAYAMLRGLRTLTLRLDRQGAAGLEVARWLQTQPEVAQVLHPALETSPDHSLWARDYTGACGLFGVVLRPGPLAAVHAMLDALRLFGLGFSWGGFESLAIDCDPQLGRTAPGAARPSGPLLRLHVGLEAVEDLKADLRFGLDAFNGANGNQTAGAA